MKVSDLFRREAKIRPHFRKMNSSNDGTRALLESIIAPEVELALRDWAKSTTNLKGVLIGGLALSFYARPRYTSDGDFLFITDADIPEKVQGFKRNRPGAFEHKKTGVEIEVVTPSRINMDPKLAQAILDTAHTDKSGIKIASPSGIIAAKLGRFNPQDKADIFALYELGDIDLSKFPLSTKLLTRYEDLIQSIKDNKNEA